MIYIQKMKVMKINNPVRIYKNYQMFLNVIMLNFSDLTVTKTVKNSKLVKLYNGDTLVGINLINTDLLKDYPDGFIYPNKKVLAIINDYLSSEEIKLSYDKKAYLKVGLVKSVSKLENSDSLTLCEVLVADKIYQIVCGASNVRENMKTIVALDKAILEDGTLIKANNVLNTYSEGMLCSKKELNLARKPGESGIIELDDSTNMNLNFFDWREKYV